MQENVRYSLLRRVHRGAGDPQGRSLRRALHRITWLPGLHAELGQGGRVIRVLLLRSMVADANDVHKYLNLEQLHQRKVEHKVDNDQRVTKVGQFIRKCSIDEMPQFLNVLKGGLSAIGPRPITKDELEQHFSEEEKEELLSVTPGNTGLWQATDRNALTIESGLRQQIELRYMRNRCFRMDWNFFVGTFGALFGNSKTGC